MASLDVEFSRVGQLPLERTLVALYHELNDADGLNEYVLHGSVVLALHGAPRLPGDVDMFVSGSLWKALATHPSWRIEMPHPDHPPMLEMTSTPVPVRAHYEWDDTIMHPPGHPDGDLVAKAFTNATLVQGWRCVYLEVIRGWKAYYYKQAGRRKDADDVLAINRLLRQGNV